MTIFDHHPHPVRELVARHPSYGDGFIAAMRDIDHRLPEGLKQLDELPETAGMAAVRLALGFACQTQNVANIELGRAALAEPPRNWLLSRIEACASAELDFRDEWEVRRFLEVLGILDGDLLRVIATRLVSSPDEGIREAARDLLKAADIG